MKEIWDAEHYKKHSKPQEQGGLEALKDFPIKRRA